MDFHKLLNTDTGSMLVSVILGLGLAALFRKACVDNRCIIVKGPEFDDLKKYHFKMNDTCYKYKPVFVECRD